MRPLLKLLADNRKQGSFRAETKNNEATLYLYDMIVSSDAEAELFGGVSPEAFVKTLAEIKADTIHVRINSPGGDVFAARAMEVALRQHSAKIIAHIDGYAASAATFVALAADEIVIAPGAFFMIHKAWSLAVGNADDMLATAELLEKIDATLIETYAARTGQSSDQIKQWMADETWFSGTEAVDTGFADSLAPAEQVKASAWNMRAYSKAPAMPITAAASETPEITNIQPDFADLQRRLQLAIISD